MVKILIHLVKSECRPIFDHLFPGDSIYGSTNFGARLSLQPKHSRASFTCDESSIDFRRKSAGSSHSPAAVSISSVNSPNSLINSVEPHIYAFDECERHPDGTVILR